MRTGRGPAPAGRRPRRIKTIAALALLIGVAATAPLAVAATLKLSVAPVQTTHTSVVTVTATGTSDSNPAACPAGIGCELTVFVIRSGSCPPQPSALIADPNIVTFLTGRGLPALIGTTPGPFSARSDYFLDGAPNAGNQGNRADGYAQSRWGTFIFCGYLQDALATATFNNPRPDELDPFGASAVRKSTLAIAVYSAGCAAFPCRVRLSERAFAAGRRVAGLDGHILESIQSAPGSGSYVVSFPSGTLNRSLLDRTVALHRSVALHFTAIVTDATGGHTTANRTIDIRR